MKKDNHFLMFKKNSITIIVVILIVIVAVSFWHNRYVNFRVVSKSMEPTLTDGSYISIKRVSRTRIARTRISRNDIIVFNYNDSRGEIQQLIKRVIAIPGDTINYFDDLIHINGNPFIVPDTYKYFTIEEGCQVLDVLEFMDQSNSSLIFKEIYGSCLSIDQLLACSSSCNVGITFIGRNFGSKGDFVTNFLMHKRDCLLIVPGNNIKININDSQQLNLYRYQKENRKKLSSKNETKWQDCFFVVGDNAILSSDSRSFGFVSYDEIIGIANSLSKKRRWIWDRKN